MKDFLLVFNILYKNANVRKVDASGKPKISQKIILLIISLPLILIFCVTMGMLVYSNVKNISQLSILITAIVGIGQIAALLFGLYGVINTLYAGDDRALLNSLPLKPVSVFMAKFALSYIQLLKISSLFILPLGLTSAITYAALGREMFYAFFVLIFLVVLIAPILPLAIITVFSLPVSYIGSYLKGHTVLKSVMSIVIYVALFATYITVVYVLNGTAGAESGEEAAFADAFNGLATFGKVFYPSKVAVECALGINGGVNFGISAAITVGLVLITTLLSAVFYRRIAQRSLEAGGDKSRHGEISYKQNALIPALIKRDFMSIIRNPQMAMPCFSNLLLAPIFIVIMYLSAVKGMSSSEEAGLKIMAETLGLSLAFLFSSIYLGGANMLAVQAFSREGKAYYLNKSLPISATLTVRAKLIFAILAATLANVIDFIVVLALYRTHFVNALMFLICSEMCIVGGIGFNIYADARYGNANWTTRQELQQSASGLQRFLISLACMLVPAVGLIVGVVISGVGVGIGLSETLIYLIFWVVCGALSAAFMGIGLHCALDRAAKYLENFGERKYTVRKRSILKGDSGGYVPPRGGLMK